MSLTLRYTASLGSGSGTVPVSLAAGRQLDIPDVLAYLRANGLAIPSGSSGQQGGTLLVTFDGVSPRELISAAARTTTATGEPQPVGSAGLAYRGLKPAEQTSPGSPGIFGLRANATDRSNVAVYNSSPTESVDFSITAFSGSGEGPNVSASRSTFDCPLPSAGRVRALVGGLWRHQRRRRVWAADGRRRVHRDGEENAAVIHGVGASLAAAQG